jgi:hypothetical protein
MITEPQKGLQGSTANNNYNAKLPEADLPACGNAFETLYEHARAFMKEHGFQYDDEFTDTSVGPPIKFDGRGEGKRKLEWLHCNILDRGIRITFGSHHADLNQHGRISKPFLVDEAEYAGLSAEERERLEAEKKATSARAKVREVKETAIANQQADYAIEKYYAASQQPPPPDAVTYYSNKGMVPMGDVRWEKSTSYNENGVETVEYIAIHPILNVKMKIRAIQELYSNKKDFGDGSPRNKRTLGKTSGCFRLYGKAVNSERIYLCEGIATAESIFQATNVTALAVLGCGAYDKVLEDIKRHYPTSKITICSDNDLKPDGKNPGLEAATAAALKYGCCLAVPQFPEEKGGTDFDDLRQLLGKEEVRRQVNASAVCGPQTASAKKTNAEAERPPLAGVENPNGAGEGIEQPFPEDVLPPFLRDITQSTAIKASTDASIAGTVAQALAATALRKCVKVTEKQDLTHFLSFFHIVVAGSAEGRKSANTKPMLEVFTRYHAEKKAAYDKACAVYRSARKAAERQKEDIFKTGSLEAQAEAAGLLEMRVEALKPKFYRLFATDVTGPAFLKRLDEAGGYFGIFSTDGGDIIDFIIGSALNGTNDMVFVKLITSDPIQIERVGSDGLGITKDIPHPAGNILLMTQDERWSRLNEHKRLRGSGLLGRMHPAIIPPRKIGYLEQVEDAEKIIPKENAPKDAWDKAIETLLLLEGEIVLILSNEARQARIRFNNEVQATVGIDQENYDVADILHRVVSEAVKRAALFHVCDHWENLASLPKEIPGPTFERAVTMQKYYMGQAMTARRGVFSKATSQELEAFLKKWIRKVEAQDVRFLRFLPIHELSRFLRPPKDKTVAFLAVLEASGIVSVQQGEGKRHSAYRLLHLDLAKQFLEKM